MGDEYPLKIAFQEKSEDFKKVKLVKVYGARRV